MIRRRNRTGAISEAGRPPGPPSRPAWLAMGLIAALLLADRLLVQPSMIRLMSDAPVINVAGRQRMLSQRLAKAALAVSVTRSGERARHLDELRRVLELWARSHRGLRRGDAFRSLPGRNSESIRRAFDALEPDYRRMRDAASTIIRGGSGWGEEAEAALHVILEAEDDYLWRMDVIVGLYEREARGRVDRLLQTGWAMTATNLIGLLVVALLILRPWARLIREQFAELRDARDELERRVRERTASLERANEALRIESRERERADRRHRELLERFSHVSRTNVIGEMATGLAHELNQPLGAIANYAEGCLVALERPRPAIGEVRAALDRILAMTLRAGEIIRRIRRFVSRQGPAVERVEPNALVAEVADLLRGEVERLGIALRTELAPDLPGVECDPVQVQQVLVNLVRNATDAVRAMGVEAPQIVMATVRGGPGQVSFEVSDNGEGIAGGRERQVFDAFFSTRADGMGMGLAISRTIVEAHQGRIEFESEPGVGTVFRVSIPSDGRDDAGTDGLHR
ncbi:ATP-binding protein [Tautonia plasticadhaerens]|uniref:histidine kinase n=1 Tax=Tautonia plasticadhaerens TaxID=2527974 RepID=A0A518H4G7_9BACT|nr:ATP-binding protein [Tautonia plasticadhaerens]QDV35735.1 Sensor protein FixL [Tautonia plasticadhaerens]